MLVNHLSNILFQHLSEKASPREIPKYRQRMILNKSYADSIYTITHDPAHADMPHEVTVIKGRRFPTCRHCKGISFELAHAAKHVGEIDHLEEAHAPAG